MQAIEEVFNRLNEKANGEFYAIDVYVPSVDKSARIRIGTRYDCLRELYRDFFIPHARIEYCYFRITRVTEDEVRSILSDNSN